MTFPEPKPRHRLPVLRLPVFFLMVAALFVFTGTAGAQILPRTVEPERFDKRFEKPVIPKSQPRRPREVPRAPQSGDDQAEPEIRFTLRGVILDGVTAYRPDELRQVYRRYLNRSVNLKVVQYLADALTAKYRNDGYILSQVLVPPQKVGREGEIRLKVVEGHIETVKFEGPVQGPPKVLKWFRKRILRSRPLNVNVLERFLLLINDQPGMRARSVLTPSKTNPGTAELTIVLEHKPVDATLDINNRGSKFNGPVQFSAGVSVNSMLRLYERIQMNGIITGETDELRYFSGSVDLPVTLEGTRLFASGSVASSQPGGGLEVFNVDGDSSSFNFQVMHPLLRTRERNLTASLGFGLINSETTLLGVTTAKDRVRFFRAGLTLDVADRWQGINIVSVRLTQGLDILGSRETGSAALSREFGESDFTKLDGELVRYQRLAPNWSLMLSSAWQGSFDNLLASQEFTAGGPRFLRGYDSSEISGDGGMSLIAELQYTHHLDKWYVKTLQPYLFFDYGAVFHKHELNRTDFFEDLKSAGAGVRVGFVKWVSGYLEVAQPIDKIVSSEGDRDARVFFGLTARY